MANFEKLVVLAVVFAAVVVVAVAFSRGGEEAQAGDPLSGAQRVLEQTPEAPPTAPEGLAPSLLLSAGDERASEPFAGLQPAAPAPAPETGTLALEPASDPNQPILLDTNGLRPSFLDEYMVYTVVAGDTWSTLAQRFYQDGRFTRNLQRANEGLVELTPELEILVPVFDFIAMENAQTQGGTELASSAPAALPVAGLTADEKPAAGPTVKSPAPAAGGAKLQEYVVKSGDTLSDISQAVFGSASRWKEIFDANRDQLEKPEFLKVGMKLKIPAGAKLPVGVAKTEKKPEAKPKAKEEASAGTPKKKKVL